jgi:membrane protease YdiL (CAAX protease family)
MRDFVRRWPLTCFFILAVAVNMIANLLRLQDPDLSRKVFGAMFGRQMKGDIIQSVALVNEFPLSFTYLLSPAAPTIAAFLVIALMAGRSGLADWATRLKFWRGVGWRQGLSVWLISYAVLFAFVGILLITMVAKGEQAAIDSMIAVFGGTPELIVLSLIYGMFLSVGPLLEEMGWRGFALPVLLQRFDPLKASIAVGCLWAAWHLPREIPVLLSADGNTLMLLLGKQVSFFIGCIGSSITATFLFFKLGGSVWSGMIPHAVHNELSVNFLRQYDPGIWVGPIEIPLLKSLELLVAALILLIAGRNLGKPADGQIP